MAQTTLIKQTLTVKKVIGKAASKFGKASIIVPLNGKDEFLGLNDAVDEKAFVEGKTYELELSVSKTGKRYVNKVLGTASDKPAVAPVSHTADAAVAPALDREVRITKLNIGNIAGTLSTGDPAGFAAAYDIVKAKYEAEGLL